MSNFTYIQGVSQQVFETLYIQITLAQNESLKKEKEKNYKYIYWFCSVTNSFLKKGMFLCPMYGKKINK